MLTLLGIQDTIQYVVHKKYPQQILYYLQQLNNQQMLPNFLIVIEFSPQYE